MSVLNETLLISLSTAVSHINMDIEKIYVHSSQLSKTLLGLLLQMRRQIKDGLTGGYTSLFNPEEIVKVLQSSSSSPNKVMLITLNLYKSWPFIKESIYGLQMKLSMCLALSAQLKHAYERAAVLAHSSQEYKVLHEEINIIVAKLDLQIIDARDSNERLLKNLMDANGILTVLNEFPNIGDIFKDVNIIFLNISREAANTWDALKKIKFLELSVNLN